MKLAVAIYENLAQAERALLELRELGVPRHQIDFIARHVEGHYASYFDASGRYIPVDPDRSIASEPEGGTGSSRATLTGLGGTVLGLAMFSIPGLGPVLAAGPLAAGVLAAGTGAAEHDFQHALARSGIPRDDARRYLDAVRSGASMLLVTIENGLLDRVVTILQRHLPVHDVSVPAADPPPT